jgi:hypothetical protein
MQEITKKTNKKQKSEIPGIKTGFLYFNSDYRYIAMDILSKEYESQKDRYEFDETTGTKKSKPINTKETSTKSGETTPKVSYKMFVSIDDPLHRGYYKKIQETNDEGKPVYEKVIARANSGHKKNDLKLVDGKPVIKYKTRKITGIISELWKKYKESAELVDKSEKPENLEKFPKPSQEDIENAKIYKTCKLKGADSKKKHDDYLVNNPGVKERQLELKNLKKQQQQQQQLPVQEQKQYQITIPTQLPKDFGQYQQTQPIIEPRHEVHTNQPYTDIVRKPKNDIFQD